MPGSHAFFQERLFFWERKTVLVALPINILSLKTTIQEDGIMC